MKHQLKVKLQSLLSEAKSYPKYKNNKFFFHILKKHTRVTVNLSKITRLWNPTKFQKKKKNQLLYITKLLNHTHTHTQ